MTGFKNTGVMHSIKRALESARIENYDYSAYLEEKNVTEEELNRQKNTGFFYEPLISVITQIGNEPVKYLDKMIESVSSQSYAFYELCIADNSAGEQAGNVISQYINKNPRIRYVRTKASNGLGANLEEALNMADGDYVVYVRANDELSPNALYELVRAINRRDRVDVVYADEDSIAAGRKQYEKPVFKPNINYDLLRTNNYIGHPMLVRKKLAKRIGGFSDRFIGAQEYDFTLRCIEGSDKVIHVSKMLYHSRDIYENDFDADEMINALNAHFERTGIIADIRPLDCPGYFRINYHMESTPHVTIIINDLYGEKQLKKCVDSIRGKTIYREYDIIVRKNSSKIPREHIAGTYVIAIDSNMTVLSNNFIEKMLARMSQGDVSVVCSKIIDRHKKILHAGIKNTKSGLKYMFEGMPSWQYGYGLRAILQQNVDAFPVMGIMLKTEDYLAIDYENPENGIDIELCELMRQNGKMITYEPDVLFEKGR